MNKTTHESQWAHELKEELGLRKPRVESKEGIEEIKKALLSKECSHFRDFIQAWKSENSTVISTPKIVLSSVLGNSSAAETALNIIHITGPTTEDLHYHTSAVVGIILSGRGWFEKGMSKHRSECERVLAKTGDVIVIPKDAYHLFNCDEGDEIVVASVEISDKPLDYQRHFH